MNKELTDTHKKFKNPERRINAVYTAIVVSVLWGALSLVVYTWGKSLLDENRQKTIKIDQLIKQNQDCNDKNYQFVLDQLKQTKAVEDFKNYQDSMNHELMKIKQTLTSR